MFSTGEGRKTGSSSTGRQGRGESGVRSKSPRAFYNHTGLLSSDPKKQHPRGGGMDTKWRIPVFVDIITDRIGSNPSSQ